MKTFVSYCCAAILICLLAGKALADPQPLFEDTFGALDPSFGTPGPTLNVSGGMLQMNPGTGIVIALYQVGFFADADISATFNCTAGDAAMGNNNAGILFWAVDKSNFYQAVAGTDGTCEINRLSGGRWLYPATGSSPAVKKGLNAANVLRVVTKGNQAMFYINGTKVFTITGMPPAGGGLVGEYSQSGTAPATWTVQDFKVLPLQ